jgi:hypothetical protein
MTGRVMSPLDGKPVGDRKVEALDMGPDHHMLRRFPARVGTGRAGRKAGKVGN